MVAVADPRLTHVERLLAAIDLPIGRWDRASRLVFCNDPYLPWAGQTREAMLGKTLQEIFGDGAWKIAAPAFEKCFAGQTVRYQRKLAHGSAPGRWAQIDVFPDTDAQGGVEAIFTIASDIHDHVMAHESLLAAQTRLDHFTNNIPYPLTYVDRNFIIQFVNKAYTEITQMKSADLVGRHIGHVRGAQRWTEHEPYFLRALEGTTTQYTRLVNSLPGGPRWLRTSYVPDLGADGTVQGLYTVTIDVHDLAVTQEKLKRRVERDALTDVLSRRTMMDRVEAAMLESARHPVALYFVDLDGFKAVNDKLGHHEGDKLLVAVGTALQQAVRAEDAVGRFGGDEFLVLAGVRDAAGAQALAVHLLAAVESVAGTTRLKGVVSASIGFAMAPEDARHPMNLLQLADDAMYAAKRCGKNRAMHCATIPFEATR
jgi:diguanylate cyclase (GGDEF)-like protein/PAS domain S-box-containing protein